MEANQLDEEAVFAVASRIEADDVREDYVRQVCSHNTALMARVQNLLQIHDQEKGFLESPPSELGVTLLPNITERSGSILGNYKLLQEIGQGSFGVVFMAEQTRPVRRKVAIKVIKPGMDSKEVIARFEAERQALAMMNHPNIAMVFDADTAESGRPFFVMELIKGVPISDFCDSNNLSVAERLGLFQTVCNAVQHAHQKGIIHRDLKPSNILVTMNAGQPLAKVIDFGVAKALNHKLTERTLFTGYGQLVGTPQYMSPEQAELSALDVDTRSDVYALGVLLYELISGQPPFDSETLRQAGFDEMRRIIREDDPPRPSTRFQSLDEGPASQVATKRRSEPNTLGKSLCGDLDYVVMKALEKNPNRRYDTPLGLAQDLQRHLDREPVHARPPSLVYRIQKMTQKHRGAVVAASLLALSLLGTLVVSLVLLQVISADRRKLRLAVIDLEQANEIIRVQMQNELANQALVAEAQAHQAIMVAKKHMLQVRSCWATFAYDEAMAHLQTALELLSSLQPGTEERAAVLEPTHWMLGMTLIMFTDQDRADQAFRDWINVAHNQTAHELWWANQLYHEGHEDESLDQYRHSQIDTLLEYLDTTESGAFTHFGRACDLTIAVTYLCARYTAVKDKALLDRAKGYCEKSISPDGALALIHEVKGEYEQAATRFEADLAANLTSLNNKSDNSPVQIWFVQKSLRHLIQVLGELDDAGRAELAFQRVIATYDEKLPPWHPMSAMARLSYSDFLVGQDRLADAEEMAANAYDILAGYGLSSTRTLEKAGNRWIKLLEENGKPGDATKARERLEADLVESDRESKQYELSVER